MVDAFPFNAGECQPNDTPFTVDLGGLMLVVLDVTEADDRIANLKEAEFYKTQLAGAAGIEGPVWFVFHKPIFTSIRMSGIATEGDNKTLVEAARNSISPNVQAILSGHLHTFQVASYVQDIRRRSFPDTAEIWINRRRRYSTELVINGVTVETGRSTPAVFGFAVMERNADEWLITNYDVRGTPLARCHLKARKLTCDEAIGSVR